MSEEIKPIFTGKRLSFFTGMFDPTGTVGQEEVVVFRKEDYERQQEELALLRRIVNTSVTTDSINGLVLDDDQKEWAKLQGDSPSGKHETIENKPKKMEPNPITYDWPDCSGESKPQWEPGTVIVAKRGSFPFRLDRLIKKDEACERWQATRLMDELEAEIVIDTSEWTVYLGASPSPVIKKPESPFTGPHWKSIEKHFLHPGNQPTHIDGCLIDLRDDMRDLREQVERLMKEKGEK